MVKSPIWQLLPWNHLTLLGITYSSFAQINSWQNRFSAEGRLIIPVELKPGGSYQPKLGKAIPYYLYGLIHSFGRCEGLSHLHYVDKGKRESINVKVEDSVARDS
jgi:hypothetical protein